MQREQNPDKEQEIGEDFEKNWKCFPIKQAAV